MTTIDWQPITSTPPTDRRILFAVPGIVKTGRFSGDSFVCDSGCGFSFVRAWAELPEMPRWFQDASEFPDPPELVEIRRILRDLSSTKVSSEMR